MFEKGKRSSVNLYHHLQGLQHLSLAGGDVEDFVGSSSVLL